MTSAFVDPTNGKWVVLFSGEVIPCQLGDACPGDAVCCWRCFEWLNSSSCSCDYNYGFSTAGEDTPCSALTGWSTGLLVLCAITMLPLPLPMFQGMYNFVRLVKTITRDSMNLRLFSLVFSLFTCSMGATALFVNALCCVAIIATRKSPRFEYYFRFDIILDWFIIFTHSLSYFAVAAVWLEAADRASLQNFSKSQRFEVRFRLFRAILYASSLLFTVLSSLFLSDQDAYSFSILGVAVTVLFILLYVRGYFKVKALTLELERQSSICAPNQHSERVFIALNNIVMTASRLIFCSSCFLVLIIMETVLPYNSPAGSSAQLSLFAGWFFVAMISFFMNRYLNFVVQAMFAKGDTS